MDFTQFLQAKPNLTTTPITPAAPSPSSFTSYLAARPAAPIAPVALPSLPPAAPPRPAVDPRAAALGGGGLNAQAPQVAAPAPSAMGGQRAPIVPTTPVAPRPTVAPQQDVTGLTPSQRFAIYAQQQQQLRAGAKAQKDAARAKVDAAKAPPPAAKPGSYPEQGPQKVPEGIDQGGGVQLNRKY